MFPLITFNFSHWQVDIVLFEDRVQHLSWCFHSWSKMWKLASLIMFTFGFVALEVSHANERDYCDQHSTNQFSSLFSNWGFQMFAQMNKCFLMWLCQCNLGNERPQELSTFCLDHFPLPTSFHSTSKDASIFYLKWRHNSFSI
jgi:hypothetical protein